jgi:hypothetical protein
VTSQLAASGVPKEVGYTTGFAVMTGCLALAALAGLLIPGARRTAAAASPAAGHNVAAAVSGDAVAGETVA